MRIKIDIASGHDIFFISDFHLFHKNVIRFDNRPFLDEFGQPDLPAMHKTIIDNWNATVDKNDIVFYLGDLCFGRWEWAQQIVDKLNGKIHFVMGNHDRVEDIKKINRFLSINDYVDLNIFNSKTREDFHFTIMHFPIYSWNRMGHGSIHVHGHCHGNLHHGESASYYENRKVIDVGCNLIDYTPISYKAILKQFNHAKS